jgi:hypothetical protein
LIFGLVNPKIGEMETVKGIDIVLRWMYPSMCADVVPSRLEKIVSQIINQLGNDRIGIGVCR